MAQDTHHMNSFKRQWRSRLASVSRFCLSSLWSLSSKCKTGHMNGFKRGWRRSEWPWFLWLLLGKRPSSFYHLSMETGSIFFYWLMLGEKGEGDGGMEVSPYLSGLSCLLFQFKQLNTGWGRRLVQNPPPTLKYFSRAFCRRLSCLVSQ